MVDEVLKQIQDKNNVGQKFHRCTSFQSWCENKQRIFGRNRMFKTAKPQKADLAENLIWNNALIFIYHFFGILIDE